MQSLKRIYEAGTIADPKTVRVGMADQGLSPDVIEDLLYDMAQDFSTEVSEVGRHIQVVQEKWTLGWQFMAVGKDCAMRGTESAKILAWVRRDSGGSFGGTR